MATRRPLEEQTTITGGGQSTSNSINLDEDEGTTLQFQGDENSTNLTFKIQAKVDPLDEWSKFDQLSNIDLTNYDNNNIIEQWDTLDLERLRVKTINNEAGKSTTIDIISSFSDQQ